MYLKTVCTVYLLYNQVSARAACLAYGMQLYRFNFIDDETAILSYSDSQWHYNRLWIEGGNSSIGLMLSNYDRTNFEKVSMPATSTYNYFYCEYESESERVELFQDIF